MDRKMAIRVRRDTGGYVTFTFAACFLILLNVVSTSKAALTTSEKAALAQILSSYPDLMIVPLWATSTADGDYFGKSWTFDFDSVCMSPGYDLYGVHCSVEGHVDGLEVNSYWGNPALSVYDNVNGLTYLKNVSSTETTGLLVETLIRTLPQLESAYIPFLIPTASLVHTGITSLTAGEHDNLHFSDFRGLLNLHVRNMIPSSYLSICSLRRRLERVSFDLGPGSSPFYASFFTSCDLISSSSVIKSYELLSPMADERPGRGTSLGTPLPSLETFTISCSGADNNISLSGTALKYLTIEGFRSVQLNTPNLKSLKLSVSSLILGNLSPLPVLEALSITSLGILELPSLPPLKSLSFGSQVSNDLLCSYVTSSLVELELSTVETVPSCLLAATSLKRLHFSQPIRQIDSSTFSNLPRSIEDLKISQGFDSASWSVEELLRFSNLKDLTASGFTGSLSSDFFGHFPQLARVSMESAALTGAVPSRGWANLESVQMAGTLTSFSGIEGTASRLKHLRVESETEMATIPSDDAMLAAQLDSLEVLHFYMNSRGPLPTFWTHLPKIREVKIECGLYTGPLPSTIQAPLLSELAFFNGSNLCGPLFDFEVPTKLLLLNLTETAVSGAIPETWNSNLKLFGSASLSGNYLTGTVPQDWFTSHTTKMELHNNPGLSGPFAFYKDFRDFSSLKLSNTSLSICEAPISNATTLAPHVSCSFMNLPCPAAGACALYWSNFCTTMECGNNPPSYVAPPTCVTPPPRPNTLSPLAPTGEAAISTLPSFLLWLALSVLVMWQL